MSLNAMQFGIRVRRAAGARGEAQESWLEQKSKIVLFDNVIQAQQAANALNQEHHGGHDYYNVRRYRADADA